jgi:uncharacterized protein YndB with AHSA1/START domain
MFAGDRSVRDSTILYIGNGFNLSTTEKPNVTTPGVAMSNQLTPTVNIPWHFDAAREKVWQAWTDPQMVTQWFGSDPDGKVLSATINARPGGTFEITFANADGTAFTCFGTYQEVDTYKKLAFTWSWINSPDVVEFVTVSLRDEPGGTHMDFEIANIDPNSAHNYEPGWKSTFEKLERALSKAG